MAARQAVDDVLGDPFAEVSFAGIAAEIPEGQHRDGWPLRPREMRLRPRRDFSARLLRLDAKDTDRPADVLQLTLAEVAEIDRHLVPDVVADGARDDDFSGHSELMDTRRDVDAVSDQLVLVHDDVFHVDADPKRQRGALVLGFGVAHRALHVEGPGHGGDCARKLHEDGVARDLQQPAAVLEDLGLDEVSAQRLPGPQRLDIVRLNKS